MESRPSDVLIWVVVGIAMLIAFYALGTLLLQAKKQSPATPDQNLGTEQLP